jgi:hypothetical protein
MSIEAYSRSDFHAAAAIVAALDDQIETDVCRYRGAIPFRDGEPLQDGRIQGSDPVRNRTPAELAADGKS